ncbi:TIGR03086 family metal-binding protein [Rhodococcus sovatensis]|uniref:TIGR03086 family metal-binding protein n=1 Tax=Rhodococcus sovatensis TaxID=1805840 RepID=A0ABZ2PNQ9_9NOCA
MTTPDIDPRPLYRDALDWVATLIREVRTEQLPLPTPCTEFDVATLIGHQLAGVRRAATMGNGGSAESVPFVLEGFGDPTSAYLAEASAAMKAWEDDAKLDTTVAAPWGVVPGRAAMWAYLNETLVHGWDLAVATGQSYEAPPEMVTHVLTAATTAIPAETRNFMPFDEVVEARPGAGPTERLANWSGRVSDPWIPALLG